MNAYGLIQYLQQHIAPRKMGSKRQIVRIAKINDYRQIFRTINQAKKSNKLLKQIQFLPFIRAIAFPGTSLALPLTRWIEKVSVEEDLLLNIHPPGGGMHSKIRPPQPFVPEGMRQIRIPEVRKYAAGNGVKIGVIDTGADFHHPDLQSVLAHGVNFVYPSLMPIDDNGHGTHIAGTIAATGNHAMKGIAPAATLYPVKAFDQHGSAYVSDIIRGIEWCVQHRMDVINMSFGMRERSDAMRAAVRKATQAGIILIASAGNDGLHGKVDYPARYAETISVGATNRQGCVAAFSNSGANIDILAPGERIMSTWPQRRYHVMNGTSMATAHVTGVIALILSVKPHYTPFQLKRLIMMSRKPLRCKYRKKPTSGRLDALQLFRKLRLIHRR